MKTNIFKLLIIVVLLISFSCSNRVGTAGKSNLEYYHNKESIILEISTGNPFLKLNEETKVNVRVENIDPKSLTFSGLGIKFSPIQDFPNGVCLDITPAEEAIEEEKFPLMLSYPNVDSIISHKFLIPVKK